MKNNYHTYIEEICNTKTRVYEKFLNSGEKNFADYINKKAKFLEEKYFGITEKAYG